MKVEIRRIEERVISLLDENMEILDERVEYGDPSVSVVTLIRELLPDAAMIVAGSADPARIFESHSAIDEYPRWWNERNAVMPLPANFLRLLYFRMSDWTTGVTVPLVFGGEEYRLYSGSTGFGRSRRRGHAVSVGMRGSRKTLDIFGSARGSAVAGFSYLTIPEISGDSIDIPRGLFADVCRKLADMVALTRRHE